jgi:hypothetical protein
MIITLVRQGTIGQQDVKAICKQYMIYDLCFPYVADKVSQGVGVRTNVVLFCLFEL